MTELTDREKALFILGILVGGTIVNIVVLIIGLIFVK